MFAPVLQKARVALFSPDNAPATVFLQWVCVLEAKDGAPTEISTGLTKLLALPSVAPLDSHAMRPARGAYVQGLDFADSLLLALGSGDEGLASFDKSLARRNCRPGITHG